MASFVAARLTPDVTREVCSMLWPKIIAICGRGGAGKDTTAAYLALRYGCRTDSLAGPLKRFLCDLFGLDMEYFEDRKLKEAPFDIDIYDGHIHRYSGEESESSLSDAERLESPRRLMQIMADSVRTRLGDAIFASGLRFRNRVSMMMPLVVTDTRQSIELRALSFTADGGKKLREHGYIIADHYVGGYFAPESVVSIQLHKLGGGKLSASARVHHTELGIPRDRVNFNIDNNGTKAELYAELDRIMDTHYIPPVTMRPFQHRSIRNDNG